MKRHLVTGGLGLVGTQLARALLDRGEEVVLFDIETPSTLPDSVRQQVEFVRGDLSSWVDVLDAVKGRGVTHVYHLGALLPPGTEHRPAAAYTTNINGTFNVLEAARLCGVEGVTYSSSTAVYGPDIPSVIPNDHAQHPVSMYGVTKACAERLGTYYNDRYGINFRGVRFVVLFGPGRIPGVGWTAYTSLMVEEAARGNPYTVQVHSGFLTQFVYVKDAVRGLVELANADEHRLTRRVYNLDGFAATNGQLVDAAKKHIPDARIEFDVDPGIQHIMETQYFNVSKKPDGSLARTDWGWTPQFGLDEAVENFINEVRAGLTS